MLGWLFRWLGLEKPQIPRLRPHRSIDLALPLDVAAERARSGLTDVLGANVTRDSSGEFTADIGLIGSERLRVWCERIDDNHTRVHAEARYAATATPPQQSRYVDALISFLQG